jgi:trimethylamine---corrinoid protein Co-methyltransferase
VRPYSVFLTDEDIQKIHNNSLDILENMGFMMPSEEALKYMESFGCDVDHKTSIVKIKPELVQDSIDKATKKKDLILYGQIPEHDMDFSDNKVRFGTMTNCTHVLVDAEKRIRRPCTTEDVINATRLLDHYPSYDMVGALLNQQDVPPAVVDWYCWAYQLINTKKHLIGTAVGTQSIRDVKRMAVTILGSEEAFNKRCPISFYILCRPPLQIDRLSLESLMECARLRIPVSVSCGTIAGATGPVTLAGNIVQSHAEVLATLVLSQQINPGTPFMYGAYCRSMDMKTGNIGMSSPEWTIMKAATGQMGKFLGLPMRQASLLRDAKLPDAQAGYESGITGMIAAICGTDMIDGIELDSDIMADMGDIAMNNEIIGYIKYVMKGMDVNENTMAMEAIKKVGHGGNFMGNKHTMQNYKTQRWEFGITERRVWEKWMKDGGKDFYQKAKEQADGLIAAGWEPYVSPEVEKEVVGIAEQANIDYSKSI